MTQLGLCPSPEFSLLISTLQSLSQREELSDDREETPVMILKSLPLSPDLPGNSATQSQVMPGQFLACLHLSLLAKPSMTVCWPFLVSLLVFSNFFLRKISNICENSPNNKSSCSQLLPTNVGPCGFFFNIIYITF